MIAYPTAVDIPSWYFDSALFSDSDVSRGDRDPFLILHVEQPEEQLRFDLVCRPASKLGADHLVLWRALRIQQELRRATDYFDITETQIMRLLGHEQCSEELRDHVIKLLRDMMHTHIRGDGKRVTWGGARRNFGLAAKLVMGSVNKDGMFSLRAGPDDRGFPIGLGTKSVPVSTVDIEVASEPPPPRPELRWQYNDPIELQPTKKRRPPHTPGFVYILSNPAMPGLIKIGKTRLDPADRAAQLQTTGVPAGFKVEYACRTPDPEVVEQAMHVAFGPVTCPH